MSNEESKDPNEPAEREPDPVDVMKERQAEEALQKDSMSLALAGGLLGLIGAIAIWIGAVAATRRELDPLAILIGVAVGLFVRAFGRGRRSDFGVVAVVIALFGLLAGNLLKVALVASQRSAATFGAVLADLPLDGIQLLVEFFRPFDIVFYVIALASAYFLAWRRVS